MIQIIGWGICGKSTGWALNIDHGIDINTNVYSGFWLMTKVFILCLPTPTINGKQDLSAIKEWLKKIKKKSKTDPLVIIRSTILPGTTDMLAERYGLQIVHVPEFLSEATALEDTRHPEFLIVGARDILVKRKVKELFNHKLYLPENRIIECSPTTAEMIKYTMNSFFALKVVFGNQLWNACLEGGADYDKIKWALETHKWGSKNGWDVWRGGKRGYNGRCLPKDTEAFTNKFKLPLLKTMKEINDKLIKETT